MNYVWYQATLSENAGLIFWFFKLFWLSFVISDILSLRDVASIVWISQIDKATIWTEYILTKNIHE